MSDIEDKQQNFMNCLLLPALKTLALTRIITCMTQTALEKGNFYNKDWNKILLNEVNSLQLPGVLKHEASKLIKPIFNEIRKIETSSLVKIPADSFCWSMYGTIDKIKTLDNWLKNAKGDSDLLVHAFTAACKFCAKDLINEVWLKMSNSQRQRVELSVDPLIKYWYTLNMELSLDQYFNDMDLSYFKMFTEAVSEKNIFTTKYFWHKLTVQQQERFLQSSEWKRFEDTSEFTYLKVADKFGVLYYNSCNCDVLFFILSQVNDKSELQEMFLENVTNLLEELLLNSWPWQRLFIPIIKMMWDYLDDHNFCDILCLICEYIENHGTEPPFVTQKDIQELFCRSTYNANYLSSAAYQPSENKKLILSGISPEEQINIILRVTVQKPFPVDFFRSVFLNDLPFFDTMKKMSDSNGEEIKLLRELILLVEYEMNVNLIIRNEWQSLENFLSFCYNTKTMPIISRVQIIFECIRYESYSLIEKFFDWCGYSIEASEQQRESRNFKSSHSNFRTPDYSFSDFILWAFNIETSNEILPAIHFKNALVPCEEYIRALYSLPFETKKTILFYIFQMFTLDKIKRKLEFSVFPEYFFNDDGLQKFKNCLIVSDLGLKLFKFYINLENPPNWYFVFYLAGWFCPLEEESIGKFKETINAVDAEFFENHDTEEVKKIIIHLLECYDKNKHRIIWKRNSDISQDVQKIFLSYL